MFIENLFNMSWYEQLVYTVGKVDCIHVIYNDEYLYMQLVTWIPL